jgi:DNA helicase-2/ATP-dependent DNA helicase PcrA
MVQECGVDPGSILAVTFTNKAANELKERIGGLIGDKAKKLWAGTFHSICARLLRQEGEAIGVPKNFTIYDDGDQQSIVKEALSVLDGDSEDKYSANEILSRISNAKNELLGVQDYQHTHKGSVDEMAARVYGYYQQKLGQNKALDFDDLLMKAVELLESNGVKIRKDSMGGGAAGLCKLKEGYYFFVDTDCGNYENALNCAKAVKEIIDIETIYLKPEIREFIDGIN